MSYKHACQPGTGRNTSEQIPRVYWQVPWDYFMSFRLEETMTQMKLGSGVFEAFIWSCPLASSTHTCSHTYAHPHTYMNTHINFKNLVYVCMCNDVEELIITLTLIYKDSLRVCSAIGVPVIQVWGPEFRSLSTASNQTTKQGKSGSNLHP